MKIGKVDVDSLYMEEQRGTLTLPIQVTGYAEAHGKGMGSMQAHTCSGMAT